MTHMSGEKTSQPTGRKPLRILYLEDSEIDHDLVKLRLSRQQLLCDLRWVSKLEDFSLALHEQTFDAVLCDSTGPEFEGQKALEMVRERQPAAAFLFLTGHRPGPVLESMKRLGADAVISKDDMESLGDGILQAVQSRHNS